MHSLPLDLIRGSHGWKEESRQHPIRKVNQCRINGVDGCEMQNFQSETYKKNHNAKRLDIYYLTSTLMISIYLLYRFNAVGMVLGSSFIK